MASFSALVLNNRLSVQGEIKGKNSPDSGLFVGFEEGRKKSKTK